MAHSHRTLQRQQSSRCWKTLRRAPAVFYLLFRSLSHFAVWTAFLRMRQAVLDLWYVFGARRTRIILHALAFATQRKTPDNALCRRHDVPIVSASLSAAPTKNITVLLLCFLNENWFEGGRTALVFNVAHMWRRERSSQSQKAKAPTEHAHSGWHFRSMRLVGLVRRLFPV